MRHLEHLGLLLVILGALAWLGIGSLIVANRRIPQKPSLIDAHADDAVLAGKLAARPMAVRPQAPGGWRETEPPELDPVEQNRLHTEVREFLAAAP